MSSYLSGAVTSLQGGRPENQDDYCFGETPSGYLIVVCDGMGGGPGGKTASYLAKTAIANTIHESPATTDRKALVRKAIQNANTAVFEAAVGNQALMGMGTTAVVLLINKRSAIVGHVGDSRLYKMRMGMIAYRTQDHSLVGEMVRQKVITEEQARLSSQSNILKRAVGVKPTLEVDVEEIAYEKGDRFVLCSDGVWGALSKKTLVAECTKKNNVSVVVESLAEHIDTLGRSNGNHHDNLTLVIAETKNNSQLHEKMSKHSIRILLAFLAITVLSLIAAFVMYSRSKSVPAMKSQIAELKAELSKRDSTVNALHAKLEIAKEKTEVTKGETSNAKINAELKEREIEQLRKENKELKEQVEKKNAAEEAKKDKETAKKDASKNATSKVTVADVKANLTKLMKMAPTVKTSSDRVKFDDLKKKIVSQMLQLPPKMNYGSTVKKFNEKTPKNNFQAIIDKLK